MNQKQEIATIRKRPIEISLSEADCERVANLAGMHGLTVSNLLENFIGDLVSGTYSNGSDERMYAEQWFERCWFSWDYPNSLLRFLITNHYNVENFIANFEGIEEHPEEFEPEAKIQEEIISEYVAQCEQEPNIPDEIRRIKEWLNELLKMKGR